GAEIQKRAVIADTDHMVRPRPRCPRWRRRRRWWRRRRRHALSRLTHLAVGAAHAIATQAAGAAHAGATHAAGAAHAVATHLATARNALAAARLSRRSTVDIPLSLRASGAQQFEKRTRQRPAQQPQRAATRRARRDLPRHLIEPRRRHDASLRSALRTVAA